MKQRYNKIQLARTFRKEATPSERIFWEHVRNRKFLGLKFRRQAVLAGFIVDFYCPALRLIIEIDGSVHEQKVEYDLKRTEILKTFRYTIIRVSASEVMQDIDRILKNLRDTISVLSAKSG